MNSQDFKLVLFAEFSDRLPKYENIQNGDLGDVIGEQMHKTTVTNRVFNYCIDHGLVAEGITGINMYVVCLHKLRRNPEILDFMNL